MRVLRLVIVQILYMLPCWWIQVSHAQSTVVLQDVRAVEELGNRMEYFIDQSKKENISTIKNADFEASTQLYPNFHVLSDVLWLRMNLSNRTGEKVWLEITNGYQDSIEVYIEHTSGYLLRRGGAKYPMQAKEVYNAHFTFALDSLGPEARWVYVRLFTEKPTTLGLRAGTLLGLSEANFDQLWIDAAYLGILLVMILYNLFFFFSTRDISYLHYVLYTLFLGLYIAFYKGLTYRIEPLHRLLDMVPAAPPALLAMFGVLFAMYFLNIGRLSPRNYVISWGFVILLSLGILLSAAGLQNTAFRVVQVIISIQALYLMYLAIYIYFVKKYAPAKFYFFGWCFFLGGSLGFILMRTNIIPVHPIANYILQIGSAIEVMLLSVALLDRINLYRRQAEAAQLAALDAARENEKLVLEQNALLEKRVKERTVELSRINSELKASEEEIRQNAEELQALNENLERSQISLTEAMERIEKQRNDILSSIQYALRIQQAMLPQAEDLNRLLPEHFLFYRPRNVVSGDFYWLAEKGGKVIFAVGDCTGHGVPGAFMSAISMDALNGIILHEQADSPGKILTILHAHIRHALKQELTENRDGLDISLCMWDPKSRRLAFAGARNPLIYCKEDQIYQLKALPESIGGSRDYILFETQYLDCEVPTVVYLSSDGYQDQFGGPHGRKFMKTHFRQVLHQIHRLNISDQATEIARIFDQWKGEEEQVDDVLVMGMRF